MNESPSTTSVSTQPPDDAPTLTEFRNRYEAADAFAKRISAFRAEVAIPAHNELRYAGHHLLKALGQDGQIVSTDDLRAGINHCKRAMYEGADAGILSALEMIGIFQTDYSNITIVPTVPNWFEILSDAEKAKELTAKPRAHQPEPFIVETEYTEAFELLAGHCGKLKIAREEMNKRIMEQKANTQNQLKTVALSVLGIFVSALGIVLALVLND